MRGVGVEIRVFLTLALVGGESCIVEDIKTHSVTSKHLLFYSEVIKCEPFTLISLKIE
jgi:hypothetical protein